MEWILDVNRSDPTRSSPRCEEVYEMEEIIGSGTFSDVVRGVHTKHGSKHAIKIIDKSKVESPKQKWRIQNEIDLHKACNHPNIVRLHEYYESDIDVCIVMELCEGGELFNRIVQKGSFNEKEASSIIKQICEALCYLHRMGLVHRDIKPENILFATDSENSEVKLADFGLAKKLETDQPKGRAMLKASTSGTTAYCAPERLRQDQESKAVDMWSIGCIMYFLLFGVPPFYSSKEDEEENDDEIATAVLEGNLTFEGKKHISVMAQDMLLRLLEREPSNRITVEQVLLHPWIKADHFVNRTENSQGSQSANRAAILKSSLNKVIDARALKEDNPGDFLTISR